MRIWFGNDSLEWLNSWRPDTLVEHLGIEITGLGDDWLEATMPLDARTRDAAGGLHGGAAAALAETLGSYAANLCLDQERARAVGQEINVNYLRPVRGSRVTGRATALVIAPRTHAWHIDVRDDTGESVSSWRLRLAIIDWPPR